MSDALGGLFGCTPDQKSSLLFFFLLLVILFKGPFKKIFKADDELLFFFLLLVILFCQPIIGGFFKPW
ncbi:hypothetical protein [Geosporobacter ferrireducens]|uniref:Uncharacterized protein n=1 Tax=Geosporobacter ferrireducens TaxID=1424294 RepID=A0A1D8GDV1_9FIRM|nr:hypothetical protein [Geosporobacter ferrireducens]AOT69081.1 hypothetical protein Gferi_05610 [Geosporobacter ferrireducens]MTI56752.1 hypothetical protein [Geosporobacter ferrireducens]